MLPCRGIYHETKSFVYFQISQKYNTSGRLTDDDDLGEYNGVEHTNGEERKSGNTQQKTENLIDIS